MSREWWSSGVFDLDMAELLFDAKRRGEAAAEVRDLVKLAGLKRGGAVLDAACGTGRHSLEFARRGHPTTGVDVTEAYLREARRLAKAAKLGQAAFEKGELRDLYRFQGSYDLVVNLFNSFGYYRSEKDNFEALGQMASALRPGGSLVMEINPLESIRANFQPYFWQATDAGYLMEKRIWTDGGRRLRNEWILAIKGGFREINWDLRLYSVDELKALFRRAGLKNIKAFRDFKGRPWKLGHRLIITGVK